MLVSDIVVSLGGNVELVLTYIPPKSPPTGGLDDASISVNSVELRRGTPRTSHLKISLPTTIKIPKFSLQQLNHTAFEFSSRIQHLSPEKKAELINSLRPLESITTVWSAQTPFLEFTGKADGEAKLFLSQWLGLVDRRNDNRVAEFSIRLSLHASPDIKFATGFSCVIRANELPKLRIDLDDLNFSFPEFDWPALSLNEKFPWPNTGGSSRLLEKFQNAPNSFVVTFTPNNPPATLVMSVNNN
jgi:hypothetical protein